MADAFAKEWAFERLVPAVEIACSKGGIGSVVLVHPDRLHLVADSTGRCNTLIAA
jgi:hypothetical protein